MQIEVFHEAGRNPEAEAIAAEGALKELDEQGRKWNRVETNWIVPQQDRAIRGLTVAVPISLAIWMVIGALLWALTR